MWCISLFEGIRYTIALPNDWTRQYAANPAMDLTVRRPESHPDVFSEGISVFIEPLKTAMTASEYYQGKVQYMQQNEQQLTVGQPGECTINGNDCVKAVYWYTFASGQLRVQTEFYLPKSMTMYVITCMTTPEADEKYAPLFGQVASSFA